MNSAYAKIVAADVAAGRLKSWKLSIAKNLESDAKVMVPSLAAYRALSNRAGKNLQGMNSKIANKGEREQKRQRLYALVERELGLGTPPQKTPPPPAAATAAAAKKAKAAEAAKAKAAEAAKAKAAKAAAAAQARKEAAARKKAAAAEAAEARKAAAAAKKAAAAAKKAAADKPPPRGRLAQYTLSPLPWRPHCPSTGHAIKCRGSVVNNLRLVSVNDMPNRTSKEVKRSMSAGEYITRFFPDARFLKEGSNGSVFKVKTNPAAIKALLGGMAHVTMGERAPATSFVIKATQHQPKYATWTQFVEDNVHEASVHAYLAKAATCAPVRCSGAKVCSAEVVPKFYAAGSVREEGLFLTLMELVNGVPLDEHVANRQMSAQEYAVIEKAVATLWMVGVSHSDLHLQNAMVLPSGRVVIIDFGMAVLLPSALRNRVIREVGDLPVLNSSLANTVWYAKNTIQNYTNQVQDQRTEYYPKNHERYYNPEGKMLRRLWNKVPAAERVRIPAVRANLWGCGAAKK